MENSFLLSVRTLLQEMRSGEGACPSPDYRIKLYIKEMHFNNVCHLAHKLYEMFLTCLNRSLIVPLFFVVFVIHLLWQLVSTFILINLLVLQIITTFYE